MIALQTMEFLPAETKFWPVMFLQASVILSTGGGLQYFVGGGGLQFFGGSLIFQGVSNFSGGSPIFQGGLQFFGGVSNRITVNVRPVRILLECILFPKFFH